MLGYNLLSSKQALAADNEGISFWYSVFCTYFQFVVYIVHHHLFCKENQLNILDKNRNDLGLNYQKLKKQLF